MAKPTQKYASISDLARIFGVTRPTVYDRVEGIKAEIGKRYGKYAILGNLVSIGVYADYEKYRHILANKYHRKHLAPFDLFDAEMYLQEEETK